MNLKHRKYAGKGQITKSVKLALIPTEATAETIKNNRLLEADEILRKKAETLRPLYDYFARGVIGRINIASYDYNSLAVAYLRSTGLPDEKITESLGFEPAETKPYKQMLSEFRKVIADGVKDAFPKGITAKDLQAQNFVKDILPSAFSSDNIGIPAIRLNSKPRMSYRPASMEAKVTHPAGSMLLARYDSEGRHIPDPIYREIYAYLNKHINLMSSEAQKWFKTAVYKKAKFDLIKDRTYTEDKFFLSLSYTKNADGKNAKKASYEAGQNITADMAEGYRTLSVVRGMSDMLYYILYDTDRKTILQQGSLNTVCGCDFKTKLSDISADRNMSKSLDYIYDKKVKDVKQAYLKTVVSQIARMAVENNAVIVFEKFSDNVKNKAMMIDDQVFKGFENALASKLSDYYDRNRTADQPGSVEIPFQFSFSVGTGYTQNGLMFAVNPAYMARKCPTTGFVNAFRISNINNVKAKKEFLSGMEEIRMTGSGVEYTFTYDSMEHVNRDADTDMQNRWTVYAEGPSTVLNRETKNYDYTDNIARQTVDMLTSSGYGENLLNELDNMTTEEITVLFRLFRDAVMRTVVKKCKENPNEYFISPVIPYSQQKKYAPSYVTAGNLANRFWKNTDK